jgi:hypothetical protein
MYMHIYIISCQSKTKRKTFYKHKCMGCDRKQRTIHIPNWSCTFFLHANYHILSWKDRDMAEGTAVAEANNFL